MKIYTDELHQIQAVHKNDTGLQLTEHDVPDDTFNGWCDTVIKGYCYRVFPEGGTAVYPYKDFSLLMAIQQLYEEKEAQVTELQLALAQLFEASTAKGKEVF